MHKKMFYVFATLSAFLSMVCLAAFKNPIIHKTNAESIDDFINADNWKILPGYQYKTSGIQTDNDEKLPADVTFPESIDDVGINFKQKGYYASGTGDEAGNMFSGIVYKNKMALEDVSVTFTINSMGANSAVGDDGWVSVSFLTKENMFSTTNPLINMGAVALLRTQTRSVTVYDHEIGQTSTGEKYSNFATGTPVSLDLDLYPAAEGATIRVSYTKESSAGVDKYYLNLEQIDFETKEVVAKKTTSSPLIHSIDYASDTGYLCFAASTDNFEKQWDLSIKNINGVDISNKSDVKPMTPEEKANIVNSLYNELNISSYCNLDGTLTSEGVQYYSPNNTSLDVNDLVTRFATHLHSFTNDDVMALANISRVASSFETIEKFKEYLDKCALNIIDNYEDIEADILIEKINAAISSLPELDDVNLSNEQKVTNIISNLQVYYYAMKEKSIIKYGAENRQKLWDDIIVRYSDKLDDIKFEKLQSLVASFPVTVTSENLKDTIFSLVPSEMIYEYFEDKIEDIRTRKPDIYNSLVSCKDNIDNIRSQVDVFKQEQKILVEDLESASAINYRIYYLIDNPTVEDLDYVFDIVTSYASISQEAKAYIEDANKLFITAAKAIEAAVNALPALKDLTKENYLVKRYDILIQNVYQKYVQLRMLSPEHANSIPNLDKLLSLVDKLDKIQNPLSAKTIMSKVVNTNEKIVVNFVDLFANYDSRNFDVTTNYGTVDLLAETVEIIFDKAGEYNVSITIKDLDYDESATASFKVTVNGKEEKPKGKGCGGSIFSTSLILSIVSAFGVVALYLNKKQK